MIKDCLEAVSKSAAVVSSETMANVTGLGLADLPMSMAKLNRQRIRQILRKHQGSLPF